MGIRYRKSINLGKGFRVNISKTGPGFSWGGKGYRITRTANGNIKGQPIYLEQAFHIKKILEILIKKLRQLARKSYPQKI